MTLQQLEDKLSQRPNSPLFAYLANEYLTSGRVQDAMALCRSGLEFYPSYTTAHLILAKCCVAEGDFHSAISAIQDLKSLGSSSVLVENFYQQCLMHLVGVPQSDITSDLVVDLPAPEDPQPDEPSPLPDDPQLAASPPTGTQKSPGVQMASTELSPEELAQIRPVNIDEEKRIVSKTLAEIYATQGEFGEAILTYQLLKQERPELTGEFDNRIRELELLLQQKIAEQQQEARR